MGTKIQPELYKNARLTGNYEELMAPKLPQKFNLP